MDKAPLRIAVLSIHSCPTGNLGTRYNGGMSVYVRELAQELGRRGHGVDIYTGSRDENHPGVMEIGDGVRLKHLKSLRLILVGGDGPRASETVRLRKLAEDLGVARTVLFAGRIPQEKLPEYYSAADALVIPSIHESFGLVALEALACGTPVLSKPVGVMESLLRNANNGQIIPDTSPPRLAETPDRFLSGRRGRPPSLFEIRDSILSLVQRGRRHSPGIRRRAR